MNKFTIFSPYPRFLWQTSAIPCSPYQIPRVTWRESWNKASWFKKSFACIAAAAVCYTVLHEIQEIKSYDGITRIGMLCMDSAPTTKVGTAKAWVSCTLSSYAERKRVQYVNQIARRCLFFVESPDKCKQFFSSLPRVMQRELLEDLLLQNHLNSDKGESPKILQAILIPEIIDRQDLLHVLNRVLEWPTINKDSLFRQIFDSQILVKDEFSKYGVHAIFCGKEPNFVYDNKEEEIAKSLESLERYFEKTGEIPENLEKCRDIYKPVTFPALPAYGSVFLSLISSNILTAEERNKLLSEVVLSDEWEMFKKEEVQDDELLGLCIGKALSYASRREYAQIKRAASFLSSESVLTVESSNPTSGELISYLRLPQKIRILDSSQERIN